jgi:hypothetical protein
MNEVKSQRFLVFSNERGTRATKIEYNLPDGEDASPDDYLFPVGTVYQHSEDVYGNGFNRNLVGCYLLSDKGMSQLVGKLLTIIDAMFTDETQRKAFKDLVQQELYGFQRDKEEMVRQTYQSIQ